MSCYVYVYSIVLCCKTELRKFKTTITIFFSYTYHIQRQGYVEERQEEQKDRDGVVLLLFYLALA